MRNSFVNTMIECAQKDERVALLMAEVGFSVVEPFEEKFPNRFFNTGIAEQSLVLTAAGMAAAGMHPVAYSMSSFLASRAFETIKVSVAYQNLPVVLVSIGSGLSYGQMGSTHHAIEESAIMRSLPNMQVEFPSDGKELSEVLKYALSHDQPFYISFPKLPNNVEIDRAFLPGEITKVRDGKDAIVFAVGMSVHNVNMAADELSREGVGVSVYSIHSAKPLDVQTIIEASKDKHVFVVDEHQLCGGIGSEIAKVILQNQIAIKSFQEIGVPDCFVNEVNNYDELLKLYGLDTVSLVSQIKEKLVK